MPRKRASKGMRSRGAREARERRDARYKPAAYGNVDLNTPAHTLSPRDLYLREKALRANRLPADAVDPLAGARQQYNALLAAEAEAGRGGRPKKMIAERKASQAADDVD
jgi:hypothetical protein